MSKKSQRYGVRRDQVDVYGRPIAPAFYEALAQDLPSWTDLPSWVNGTEHLLPDNDDEPESNAFFGDIQYPSGLEEDARFFYRKSPTEEDGLAKIRSIKGWTVVWNQLAKCVWNDASSYNGIVCTSSSDGKSVTIDGTVETATRYLNFTQTPKSVIDHVYYVDRGTDYTSVRLYNDGGGVSTSQSNRRVIQKATANNNFFYSLPVGSEYDNLVCVPQIIDLTVCLGSVFANSILAMEQAQAGSGVAFWKSYWWLAYYKHDPGRLLSFTADKIKTVGKNLFDPTTISLATGFYNVSGVSIDARYGAFVKLPAGNYRVSVTRKSEGGYIYLNKINADGSFNYFYYLVAGSTLTNQYVSLAEGQYLGIYDASGSNTFYGFDIQIEVGSETTDFEPYVSHETSLPTDTFFPTGMKSVGSVYDELTPTRAITRIGSVDLGTLTWGFMSTSTESKRMYSDGIKTLVKPSSATNTKANIICALYATGTADDTYLMVRKVAVDPTGRLIVYDPNYNEAGDVSDFTTALDGVYLFYELAEPVVQSTMDFGE